ncbi:DUF1707 domain-containing protein [Kutzneria buriramensis]|uniref:DUF1707 SHOCT-like domain-containing protein n=1 Tax=Kutzneria buriramensis TaxID=1045776 RepID=UPI001FE332F7|nr:DUF1707 domain-containing protein [Kutzneria buriramensis]
MNESPDMRIGDTEREQALAALGEHMSAGRLTIDEYGERSAKVTAARTRGELVELFTDLPDPQPGSAPRPQPAAAPTQPPAKIAEAEVSRRTGLRVSMATISAASWPVCIAIGLTTERWQFMAVPFLLSWFTGALWGRGRHDDRDQGRRERDRWREERHQIRDDMRRRRREIRGD